MKTFASIRQIAWNLLLMTFGSCMAAAAINGLLLPQGFVSGGVIGVAMIVYKLAAVIEVGWIYLLLNLPIYLLAWFYVGRRFFFYSIAGVVIFSTANSLIHPVIVITEPLLAAVLAGILAGVGSGTILRSLGSSGGLDILSVIVMKRFSIRLGTTVLVFNSVLLCLAAFLFSLEAALYTLIYMYVNSQILNLVVVGLSKRKSAVIISPQWKEISEKIKKEINRGVTLLHAQGGYTGREGKVIYTVFTFQDLPRLKEIIRNADPDAFVVFNDTIEVMGYRIGNQPHW